MIDLGGRGDTLYRFTCLSGKKNNVVRSSLDSYLCIKVEAVQGSHTVWALITKKQIMIKSLR